jgi:hypothetical protein
MLAKHVPPTVFKIALIAMKVMRKIVKILVLISMNVIEIQVFVVSMSVSTHLAHMNAKVINFFI